METLNRNTTSKTFTYKVSKNEKYGDYRVDEYKNGVWNNQRYNNWTKEQAQKICNRYNSINADYPIMG